MKTVLPRPLGSGDEIRVLSLSTSLSVVPKQARGVAGVRETPQPSVTFLWYAKLGFRVVHRFPPDNGRVVLARDLEPGLFDRRG